MKKAIAPVEKHADKTIAAHRIRLYLALVLAVMTAAVFWPATQFDFLGFDDNLYVTKNLHVTTGLTLENIRWAFTSVHENWWLPLLWISYMADSTVWGTAPAGYHLTNILLHALNAALLFWFFSALTGSRWRSAGIAAIFAIHPLRVESVAWIAERKDVLSGLFLLLALLAYLRHASRPAWTRLARVFVLMLLGLMSKASVIVLPCFLLLLDYWPLRRAQCLWGRNAWRQWWPLLREKSALFALTLVFIFINLHTHIFSTDGQTPVSLPFRIGLMFPNYWVYLRLMFWPVELLLIHPEHDVVYWPASLAALAGLLAITSVCWRLRARYPYLLFGWFWFLIGLLPVIRGVRLGLAAYAGRFTYLPSIGLLAALVWAAGEIASRWRGRQALVSTLVLGICAACAWQTRTALPLWKNYFSAFQNIVEHVPDDPIVHNGLGAYYAALGRTNEALYHLKRCLEIKPNYGDAHLNLASLCLRAGKTREAIAHYRIILEFEANRIKVLNNIAWFLATLPDATPAERQEALRHARRAIELMPSSPPPVLDTLAAAYAANGDYAQAAHWADQAIALAHASAQETLVEEMKLRRRAYRAGKAWTCDTPAPGP